MVSAGHYNALKLERDQLAANMARIKEELQNAASQYVACMCDHPSCRYCRDRKDINDVLAATPEQSLLIHDAELMESEAKAWLRDGNATSMYSGRNVNCVLSARARELRDDAEGKA
jgi:hypothetical protein